MGSGSWTRMNRRFPPSCVVLLENSMGRCASSRRRSRGRYRRRWWIAIEASAESTGGLWRYRRRCPVRGVTYKFLLRVLGVAYVLVGPDRSGARPCSLRAEKQLDSRARCCVSAPPESIFRNMASEAAFAYFDTAVSLAARHLCPVWGFRIGQSRLGRCSLVLIPSGRR